MRHLYTTLTVVLLCSICNAMAWSKIDKDISLSCSQTHYEEIDCNYRLLNSVKIPTIEAQFDGKKLEVINKSSYPYSSSKTAILFLVDTSDPGRQNVIDNNILQIKEILQKMQANDIAGLASFDKELVLQAPIGSSIERLQSALSSLKATGRTTELYRNIREAILYLADINADRKVIYLFSDGQAEDKAYFHKDVLEATKQHKVIINSLGFPRTSSLSVALQTIRRLSEESGGLYIESDRSYHLPEFFIRNPLKNIRGGGRFSINLAKIKPASEETDNKLVVNFKADQISLDVQLPITRPGKKSVSTEPTTAKTEQLLEDLIEQRLQQVTEKVEKDLNKIKSLEQSKKNLPLTEKYNTPEVRIIESSAKDSGGNNRLIYLIPIILLIILFFTLVILVYTLMKGRKNDSNGVVMQSFKPYAYLIQDDDLSRLFPITSTTWRIGRSKDNEMSFNDHSISRRHAEIHRSQGDEFNIIDLDSMNGLFVNSEKVKFHILKDGDIIEIGDLTFRFSLYGPDHQQDEKTSMLKTKSPDISFE